MNTAMSHDEFRLWGPILQFLKMYLKPDHEVLEVGAGPGDIYPHGLRGKVRRLAGIDPDPRILQNEHLDEAVVGLCEKMQFPDASFDIVFHRMLAEHLSDPEAATIEIGRVLKPGGLLIVHTPNKLHYSMIASRFTPMWFHRAFLRLLRTRSDPGDVHLAHYKINSVRAIRRICRSAKLEVQDLWFMSTPPGYLRFSPIAFLAGTLYLKIVEQHVPRLRTSIVLVARKP
jgi:ubiquinone/menaquinone biosynthesis C-methylase UbiE